MTLAKYHGLLAAVPPPSPPPSLTHVPECPSHCTLGAAPFFTSSSPIFCPIMVSSEPKMSVRLSARSLRLEPICTPSANTSSLVCLWETCRFCSSIHRGSRRPIVVGGRGCHLDTTHASSTAVRHPGRPLQPPRLSATPPAWPTSPVA